MLVGLDLCCLPVVFVVVFATVLDVAVLFIVNTQKREFISYIYRDTRIGMN